MIDKITTAGTHRAASPLDTWNRIQPLLPSMGITRVADLTGLDVIGIPVFQAVRPNSRTLSVSQGKGISASLARVSAAMESIELWHAEELSPAPMVATVHEMESNLPYSVFDLLRPSRSALTSDSRIPWIKAAPVTGGAMVWVPEPCVRLGLIPAPAGSGRLPMLHRSSNGLASGNSLQEALLHAMYEVIERDALARTPRPNAGPDLDVDPASAYGASKRLLDHFEAASVDVRIRDLTPVAQLPCYEASIWSREFPIQFYGWGCHSDVDVAVSRSLTEAAQARLTAIAGARDDLPTELYEWPNVRRRLTCPFPSDRPQRRIPEPFTGPMSTFMDDILQAVATLHRRGKGGAYWVDLTRPEIGIPVVKVIAPGMLEGKQ
ncbi:YcaO-like family protein [Streptomyces sp. NPDC099088]|uniref:YcaO-like family protein n=1 Tax=Streptomyces sp. NPDC099088 TaxID=3366101 RepID=UPI0037F9F942